MPNPAGVEKLPHGVCNHVYYVLNKKKNHMEYFFKKINPFKNCKLSSRSSLEKQHDFFSECEIKAVPLSKIAVYFSLK